MRLPLIVTTRNTVTAATSGAGATSTTKKENSENPSFIVKALKNQAESLQSINTFPSSGFARGWSNTGTFKSVSPFSSVACAKEHAPLEAKPKLGPKPKPGPKPEHLRIHSKSTSKIADAKSHILASAPVAAISALMVTSVTPVEHKKAILSFIPTPLFALTETWQRSAEQSKPLLRIKPPIPLKPPHLSKISPLNPQEQAGITQIIPSDKETDKANEACTSLKEMLTNELGIIVEQKSPSTFYYFWDQKKQEKVLVGEIKTTDKKVPADDQRKGSSKKLHTEGEEYVSLKILKPARKRNKKNEMQMRRANSLSAKYLLSCDAIYPSFFVSPSLAVAKNGGDSLYDDYFLEGEMLPVNAFSPLIKELETLALQKIHFPDLKIEDMTVKNGSVIFIDTDAALNPEQSEPAALCLNYLPFSLYSELSKTLPTEKEENIRATTTRYLMMFALIQVTLGAKGTKKQFMPITRDHGLSGKELGIALAWIKENIREEHQAGMALFMKDPLKNREKCPSLLEVIKPELLIPLGIE